MYVSVGRGDPPASEILQAANRRTAAPRFLGREKTRALGAVRILETLRMRYFTIEELCASATARRKGIDNTPTDAARENLTALVENVLDPLREAWGKAIRVNSGYRCAALNKAVGGASSSQHLTGQAADITAGGKAANKRLFALAQEIGLPFDQLIDEKNCAWVHVSYSPRNRRQVLKL